MKHIIATLLLVFSLFSVAELNSNEEFYFLDEVYEPLSIGRGERGPLPGRLHVGIFKRMSPYVSTGSEKENLEIVTRVAKEVQDNFRYYLRHKTNVEVRGYVFKSDCNYNWPVYCQTAIREYIETHDMKGFNPNYHHVWGGYHLYYCGSAILGGTRSVTYSNCGLKVMVHELYHNLGLHHSSTLNEDGTFREYGDGSTIMGGGSTRNVPLGINVQNFWSLGLESDRETYYINSTSGPIAKQILLSPIELLEYSLHENEYQSLIIDDTYFISLRKARGWPYALNVAAEEVLYIYKKQGTKSVRLIPDIELGGTKVLPNGIIIEYLEYFNETAKINIRTDFDTPINTVQIPTGFPKVFDSFEVIPDKYTGLWYNPDYYGQGFDIQIKNGRIVLYWYTYNEDKIPLSAPSNTNRFYIGVGTIENGVSSEFDIITTENGTFSDPTQRIVKTVGRGRIQFLSDDYALFLWNMEEFGRGSLELTPIAFSDNPITGSWFQESRVGEGFSIQFFDYLDSCVVYWFTYRKPKLNRYSRAVPNTTQQWFMGSGTRQVDNICDVIIYETDGGKILRFDDITLRAVGTGRVEVIDNNNIEFEYDITANTDIESSGIFNLRRLF